MRWEQDLDLLLATLALVFAVDRCAKACAFRCVLVGEERRIASVLTIRPVRNARFTLGSRGSAWTLCASFGLALVCALLLVSNDPRSGASLAIGLGAALGGALGNLYDRIRHGAVLDFLHVGIGGVFNPADVALVLGLVAVLGAHLDGATSTFLKG